MSIDLVKAKSIERGSEKADEYDAAIQLASSQFKSLINPKSEKRTLLKKQNYILNVKFVQL